MPVCPVCLKKCIEIKDGMAIHRYSEWVANMCVISPRTIASQHSLHTDAAKSPVNNEPFKYVSVSGKQKSKPRRAGKA